MSKRNYGITPVPAPRMTRSDAWRKRPCVLRYFAFRDEVKLNKVWIEDGAKITFFLPMPSSWSEKKKELFDGQPHRQKPDIDNILKSLLDSVFESDSHISRLSIEKKWSYVGKIEVEIGDFNG